MRVRVLAVFQEAVVFCTLVSLVVVWYGMVAPVSSGYAFDEEYYFDWDNPVDKEFSDMGYSFEEANLPDQAGIVPFAAGDVHQNDKAPNNYPDGLYAGNYGNIVRFRDPMSSASDGETVAHQCTDIFQGWSTNLGLGKIDGKNTFISSSIVPGDMGALFKTVDGESTITQPPDMNPARPPSAGWYGSEVTTDGMYWSGSGDPGLPNSGARLARTDPRTGATVISNQLTSPVPNWGNMNLVADYAGDSENNLYSLVMDKGARKAWVYKYDLSKFPDVSTYPLRELSGPMAEAIINTQGGDGAGNVAGFAYYQGYWWGGTEGGALYRADPATGQSVQISGNLPKDNVCQKDGSIYDLASSDVAPPNPGTAPRLGFEKSVDKPNAVPGDKVTYTVKVKNTGDAPFTGSVPDDMSKVLDKADYNNDGKADKGAVAFSSPTLTWTGSLRPGESTAITYSVTVKKNPADGQLMNVVTPPDGVDSDCNPCSTTTDVVRPRLEINKVADRPEAKPGETITYTVTVKNVGDGPFTDSVSDDMSKVLDKADYNNDVKALLGEASFTAPKLGWKGKLQPGEETAITYSVKVKDNAAPGQLVNVVTPPDGVDSDCDPCSTTTDVPPPKLEIEKSVDKTDVKPGETVTYTVTVKNAGGSAFKGPLTDDMSKVLDKADYNNDVKASVGKASFKSPNLVWTGELGPDKDMTITYSVKVKSNVKAGDQLVNVVTPPDGVDADCNPCTSTVETGKPKLEIEKSVDKTDAKPGETVTYTVTVKNVGDGVFRGPLTDDMSKVLDKAGYSKDVKASVGKASFKPPNLVWTGELGPDKDMTITYSVKVKSNVKAGDQLVNVITPPDGIDTDCDPCTSTVEMVSPSEPKLPPTGANTVTGLAGLAGLLLVGMEGAVAMINRKKRN